MEALNFCSNSSISRAMGALMSSSLKDMGRNITAGDRSLADSGGSKAKKPARATLHNPLMTNLGS